MNKTTIKCPSCNKSAELVEGTFYFDAYENVTIRDAPLKTILIVSAYIAARQIESGRYDETPLLQSAAILPEPLAELARSSLATGGLRRYLRMMLTAVALMVGASSIHGTVDINILVDQVITSMTGARPYPGLTQRGIEAEKPKTDAKGGADGAAPTEERKREPDLSKRQLRRQRGQAKMLHKRTSKSSSPKKKC